MTRCVTAILAVLCALVSSAAAQTTSLYLRERQTRQAVNPLLEGEPVRHPVPSLIATPEPKPQIFKKHDFITIIVRETASSSVKASAKAKRDSSINGAVNAWPKLELPDFILKPADFDAGKPAIDAALKRDFSGDGSSSRSESLITRIEAEIIEIKPNGNLVLQASKMVRSGEDAYALTLTGQCAARNVTGDYTILSTQIAELQVVKTDIGAANDATKRGLFHKFLDKINLF